MTESDNGAAPRQLTLFSVESIATAPPFSPSYDPYWEEITNGDHWNPAHFGEAPRLVDDDSDEPPDPDDFLNQTEYEQAWEQWESARVLEQDTQALLLVSSHNQSLKFCSGT